MKDGELGDKQKYYDGLLKGCRDRYGDECDVNERERVELNVEQPGNMVNFTETGYKKVRLPEHAFSLLSKFWERNKNREELELWDKGDMTTNFWEADQHMVNLESNALRGGGQAIKEKVWKAAEDVLTEWTGQELRACSLYGIRVYHTGSVLSPHVDRFPLVSSAIVNVAQDVDEPWPLEVYGRDGKAVNITMNPGDMVLYESHSLIHGRPFPLKGKYMANVFIHFEPKAVRDDGLPVYLKVDAPDEIIDSWKANLAENAGEGLEDSSFLESESESESGDSEDIGVTEAHIAAFDGDTDTLLEIAEDRSDDLHAPDENGWMPIHEAARGGHKDAVDLLVHHGADVNERANFGEGPTPLHLVVSEHGEEHHLATFLQGLGAIDIGPDL